MTMPPPPPNIRPKASPVVPYVLAVGIALEIFVASGVIHSVRSGLVGVGDFLFFGAGQVPYLFALVALLGWEPVWLALGGGVAAAVSAVSFVFEVVIAGAVTLLYSWTVKDNPVPLYLLFLLIAVNLLIFFVSLSLHKRNPTAFARASLAALAYCGLAWLFLQGFARQKSAAASSRQAGREISPYFAKNL